MKIETSLLESWLLKYEDAPINLGESGVVSFSVGDLLNLIGLPIEKLSRISLENNDTYGSLELSNSPDRKAREIVKKAIQA
jgi:hypothetical protein